MENRTYTHPSVLTLGFREMSSIRYLYGVTAFLFYQMVIMLNGTVIANVLLYKNLQEPMYILVSVLCSNGLYGTTAIFPSLIFNLCSNTKTISYAGCVIQAFCANNFARFEMIILANMAYDRYVCIFNPLRYINIMSLAKVYKLLAFSWLSDIILLSILFILTIRLPLCGTDILKVYCDNWSIVRLSCVDIMVNNYYGLCISLIHIVLIPLLIIISYIKILTFCLKSQKNIRAKALQTCTPHLITMTIYVFNLYFELFVYRFIPENLNYGLRTVMSVQPVILPSLFNPLLYGLKLKEMRVKILQTFHLKTITV